MPHSPFDGHYVPEPLPVPCAHCGTTVAVVVDQDPFVLPALTLTVSYRQPATAGAGAESDTPLVPATEDDPLAVRSVQLLLHGWAVLQCPACSQPTRIEQQARSRTLLRQLWNIVICPHCHGTITTHWEAGSAPDGTAGATSSYFGMCRSGGTAAHLRVTRRPSTQ